MFSQTADLTCSGGRGPRCFRCTLAHALPLCAGGQKAEPPAASSSSANDDEALVPALPANLERVSQPQVAPPVNRKKPASVHVELEARPVTGLLAEGIGYH